MFSTGKQAFCATTSLFAIFAIAIATGCGGSSDSSSASSDGPMSKAAFVEQANAICQSAEEERKEGAKDLASESADAGPADEAAVGTELLVAPVKTMTEELAELEPPKGNAKQVAAIVAAFEAGAAKLETDPAGPESASAFHQANELSLDYGLTSCTI